jgi:hypothetical protein
VKAWLGKQWTALRRKVCATWRSWRGKRWPWWAVRVASVAAIVIGCIGVERATNWWPALLLLVAAALPALPRFAEVAGRLAGALLIAAVALVGFNIVVGWVLDVADKLFGTGDKFAVWIGLILAIVVVFAIALWYLWGANWRKRWTRYVAAALLALVAILLPPILIVELRSDDHERVSGQQEVSNALDVLIVTNGAKHDAPTQVAHDPTLDRFDVRYSVGVADGSSVSWKLVAATQPAKALTTIAEGKDAANADTTPARRRNADAVLVLVVDGTPPAVSSPESLDDIDHGDDDLGRWHRVAGAVRATIDRDRKPTPAFALLQTTGKSEAGGSRLADWDGFTTGGTAASMQGLQALSLTDAGLMLAIGDSRKDLALAFKYRPAMLFDSEEPVPRPLSIDKLFRDGAVYLCDDKPLTGDGCPKEPTKRSGALVSGGKHLKLKLPNKRTLQHVAEGDSERLRAEIEAAQKQVPAAAAPPEGTPPPNASPEAPIGAGSTIYVHPVHQNGRLYLDYWWYLSDNPARAGAGSMCGAGLVISGATCHDHESDWEGVTVVVDVSGPEPTLIAVNYAQHNRVASYPWNALRDYWDKHLQDFEKWVDQPASRPLVFVASGTHASYPTPCDANDCKQVGGSRIARLGEGRHDGELEWGANNSRVCGEELCLQLLPTSVGGQQPALWNDFTGAWGQTHCFLKYYCNSGDPPGAPGHQGRYGNPAKATPHTGPVDR